MDTKKRLLTLAAALSISLTACEGFPTEPTLGLETGEAALSLAALTHTEVTIGFESIVTAGAVTLVKTHEEEGFTLVHSGRGFNSPGTGNPALLGSKTLIPMEGVTSLTKDDDGAFHIVSIDLAEVPFPYLASVTTTFTGTTTDGSEVEATFKTDGSKGLQTFTFSASFTDLVSLSWTQGLFFPHQFDNIVLRYGSSGSQDDPATRNDCKKGGFVDFGFRNQGDCVRFVETGKHRR